MVKIIVAYDPNLLIGKNGGLPWPMGTYPEDMKHFKATTIGHVVVMGYNTYKSLGMPFLPKRDNVVITRDPVKRTIEYQDANPTQKERPMFASSLDEALRYAKFVHEKKDVFIIGGASIYKMVLEADVVDEIIASQMKLVYGQERENPSALALG